MGREKREILDEDGSSRGFYSEDNRVNDLTGREWVFWTRSVITKPYPPNLQHALRNRHGGQKPPDLCADLLRIFTKEGQSVLDPFMGVGGTLLGASLSGRNAVGVEINPAWIEVYREVCARERLTAQQAIEGDAREALPKLKGRSFDCVLTDVPYWSMDTVSRSRGTYKKVGSAARPVRASKLSAFHSGAYRSKEEWLSRMAEIFALAASLLKSRGYLLTFIGDMYRDNEYHCLSAELAAALGRIRGLVWKANLVWYDVSKKLHLYGYQYSYIPSLIHQNILVFRKESGGKEPDLFRGMNFKAADVDGKMMRTGHLALVVAIAAWAALFPASACADSILPVQPMAAPLGPSNGMVEMDSTGGGTIDYRVYYDGRGKVAREELASRHDGRMDTFYYYRDGILQKVEIDSKGSGKIDLWVYLLDGKYVQRYERDTTGSGKPDVVRVFGPN